MCCACATQRGSLVGVGWGAKQYRRGHRIKEEEKGGRTNTELQDIMCKYPMRAHKGRLGPVCTTEQQGVPYSISAGFVYTT